jgi:hypothetical protein
MPRTLHKSSQFRNAGLLLSFLLNSSRYATIAWARETPIPGSLIKLAAGASFGFIRLSSSILHGCSTFPKPEIKTRENKTHIHTLIINAKDRILFCPASARWIKLSISVSFGISAVSSTYPLIIYRAKIISCSFFNVRNDSLGSSWLVSKPLLAMGLSSVSARFEYVTESTNGLLSAIL